MKSKYLISILVLITISLLVLDRVFKTDHEQRMEWIEEQKALIDIQKEQDLKKSIIQIDKNIATLDSLLHCQN